MENKAKECPYCGTKFFPQRKNQKYCTYRCGILYNQKFDRRKYEPRFCTVCGEEFLPRTKVQVTCGKPDCVKRNPKKARRKAYAYRYSKWEGLSLSEKQEVGKKMPDKKWNELSASERWRLMSWEQISAECARLHITYGQAQTMLTQGTLPEDFGKRTENNG